MNEQLRPVTIAVAGGTGSGKTTISNAILERVGSHHIAYIPHDAYYKDRSDIPLDRTGNAINFDHPDALDTALMREHILALQAWQPVEIPVYDFTIHQRTAANPAHRAAADHSGRRDSRPCRSRRCARCST